MAILGLGFLVLVQWVPQNLLADQLFAIAVSASSETLWLMMPKGAWVMAIALAKTSFAVLSCVSWVLSGWLLVGFLAKGSDWVRSKRPWFFLLIAIAPCYFMAEKAVVFYSYLSFTGIVAWGLLIDCLALFLVGCAPVRLLQLALQGEMSKSHRGSV